MGNSKQYFILTNNKHHWLKYKEKESKIVFYIGKRLTMVKECNMNKIHNKVLSLAFTILFLNLYDRHTNVQFILFLLWTHVWFSFICDQVKKNKVWRKVMDYHLLSS